MKRILLLTVISFSFVTLNYAQVVEKEKELKEKIIDTTKTGWKVGGVTGFNLAQTELENWAAGGQESFTINGLLSVFAKYKKNKSAWDNSLDIGYGIMRQGDEKKFFKTDDKIDFVSKYGREAVKNFYYAALLNFKTQLNKGFKYPNDSDVISNFLAPAYIVLAVGMDYKPNNYISAFVAPVTGKITIVNNQDLANVGSYGVDAGTYDTISKTYIKKGKKIKNEFGGYVRIIFSKNDFKSPIMKNVSITTKIDLFSNYAKDPQNIDVSWETQIAMKVNKYITVNFNTHLLYDHDIKIPSTANGEKIEIGPRTQFKEILGVGLSYNF